MKKHMKIVVIIIIIIFLAVVIVYFSITSLSSAIRNKIINNAINESAPKISGMQLYSAIGALSYPANEVAFTTYTYHNETPYFPNGERIDSLILQYQVVNSQANATIIYDTLVTPNSTQFSNLTLLNTTQNSEVFKVAEPLPGTKFTIPMYILVITKASVVCTVAYDQAINSSYVTQPFTVPPYNSAGPFLYLSGAACLNITQ